MSVVDIGEGVTPTIKGTGARFDVRFEGARWTLHVTSEAAQKLGAPTPDDDVAAVARRRAHICEILRAKAPHLTDQQRAGKLMHFTSADVI